MGLDMYAFSTRRLLTKPVDFETDDADSRFFYWRKHPNLHGWFERLYRRKGGKDADFNLSPVLLTADDLGKVERVIRQGRLPVTTGFFFGSSSDDDMAADLKFVAKARAAIADGCSVYYMAWW